MGKQKPKDAAERLIALVCWYGHEDNMAYCQRIVEATKFVRRHFPEGYREAMREVKAVDDTVE